MLLVKTLDHSMRWWERKRKGHERFQVEHLLTRDLASTGASDTGTRNLKLCV